MPILVRVHSTPAQIRICEQGNQTSRMDTVLSKNGTTKVTDSRTLGMTSATNFLYGWHAVEDHQGAGPRLSASPGPTVNDG
jgi:hypothetical protein